MHCVGLLWAKCFMHVSNPVAHTLDQALGVKSHIFFNIYSTLQRPKGRRIFNYLVDIFSFINHANFFLLKVKMTAAGRKVLQSTKIVAL
jgi:hypothetical protein